MRLCTIALGILTAGQLLAASTALAQDEAPAGPLDLGNFSTTLYLTNQYMFRGISNSDGPAIQGSVDWGWNGFYLGAWGSNTEFSDSDIEIDGYGGYRFELFGLGVDIAGLYYWFPGEDEDFTDPPSDNALDPGFGVEADYIEAQVLVSKSFETAWSPAVAVRYNYSPDNFGEDGESHNFQGDVGVTVPLGFLGDVGFSATAGYVTVEGDKSSGAQLGILEPDGSVLDGYDYLWGRAGIYKDIGGFKLDLSYHLTDQTDDLRTFYPDNGQNSSNFGNLIEPHVVFTVSRTFSFP